MASPKHLAMLNAGPGIMWGLWPRLGNGSPRDAPLTGTGGTLWEGPLAAIGLIACIEDQDDAGYNMAALYVWTLLIWIIIELLGLR